MMQKWGWPATLCEPSLLEKPVELRANRVREARTWREIRLDNASWLGPWETTDPESPHYRASFISYLAILAAMRREALLGKKLSWIVYYGDEFVGQVSVGNIAWGFERAGRLGFWISKRFAGRGITPTAVAMAVDHSFQDLGLHRLEANIRPENIASKRVVEKLGFRDEGLRNRQAYINGAWRDHLCYAVTAEDVPSGLITHWRSVVAASRTRAASKA